MYKNKIITQKTARYFTSLPLKNDSHFEKIVFLFHGYAQLADEFLLIFKPLFSTNILFIAPEGHSKFYRRGVSGEIGASWMTKVEREDEIEDYLYLLKKIYLELPVNLETSVYLLGFSQGTSTASRWYVNGNFPIQKLILHSGFFAKELLNPQFFDKLNKIDTDLIVGDEDRFISLEQLEEYSQLLRNNRIKYNLHLFNGKHEINIELIRELLK